MKALWVIFVISACITVSGCITAILITYAMIGEINLHRPKDRQISYLWTGPFFFWDTIREYREFYPSGKLRNYFYAGLISFTSGMAITAVCIIHGLD